MPIALGTSAYVILSLGFCLVLGQGARSEPITSQRLGGITLNGDFALANHCMTMICG